MRSKCCLALEPQEAYQLGFSAAKLSFRLSSNPYVGMPAYDEWSDCWVSGWYSFFGLKA